MSHSLRPPAAVPAVRTSLCASLRVSATVAVLAAASVGPSAAVEAPEGDGAAEPTTQVATAEHLPTSPDWQPQACGTAEAQVIASAQHETGEDPGAPRAYVAGAGWCDGAGDLLEGSLPVWLRLVAEGGYASSTIFETTVTVSGGSFSTAVPLEDLGVDQEGSGGSGSFYLKVSVGLSGAVDTSTFVVGAGGRPADGPESAPPTGAGDDGDAPGSQDSQEGTASAPGPDQGGDGSTQGGSGGGSDSGADSAADSGSEGGAADGADGSTQGGSGGGSDSGADPGTGDTEGAGSDGAGEAGAATGGRPDASDRDPDGTGSDTTGGRSPEEGLPSSSAVPEEPAGAGGSPARAYGSGERPPGSPEPPVGSASELSAENAGSVSGSRQGSTVVLFLPADRVTEGDWVSVFIFPGAQSPGWVQVDSASSVSIDISFLESGTYELAVADRNNMLIGWARLEVYQAVSPLGAAPVADVYPGGQSAGGYHASSKDWLLAGACVLLVVGAAGSLIVARSGSGPTARLRAAAARVVSRS